MPKYMLYQFRNTQGDTHTHTHTNTHTDSPGHIPTLLPSLPLHHPPRSPDPSQQHSTANIHTTFALPAAVPFYHHYHQDKQIFDQISKHHNCRLCYQGHWKPIIITNVTCTQVVPVRSLDTEGGRRI